MLELYGLQNPIYSQHPTALNLLADMSDVMKEIVSYAVNKAITNASMKTFFVTSSQNT